MTQLYVIPNWFFGYDIALEILFGIITLLVSLYAFKLYKISQQRQLKLFSLAFFLISVSFFLWSVLNIVLVKELSNQTKVLYIEEINVFSVLILHSHIFLFMAALVTLFYMTTGIKSRKVYTMLIVLSTLVVLLSLSKSAAIYITSSVLLVFIVYHYITEYIRTKNKKIGAMLAAFVLLLGANINIIFATKNYMHYVTTHLLELCAFLIILGSFIAVVKHGGQKKKST